MEEGKVKSGNKGLVILLGVLGVVIVGLVVGIVVVNIKSNESVVMDEGGEPGDLVDGDEVGGGESEEEDREDELPAIEDFLAEMEVKISSAETDEEKAELYLWRAGELYNRRQSEGWDFKDMVLADVYAAESLNPSMATAYNIYMYESEFGDIDKAKQYLEIAEERGLTYNEKV